MRGTYIMIFSIFAFCATFVGIVKLAEYLAIGH